MFEKAREYVRGGERDCNRGWGGALRDHLFEMEIGIER